MEKYSEKPLSVPGQLQFLKDRGLLLGDDDFARNVLETVSYYRLKAFLYPFRRKDAPERFSCGASFENAWEHYRFDRKLRLLLLDAIERVEVAVKTLIVNHFSLRYGPFGHLDFANFAETSDKDRHNELLHFLEIEMQRSRDEEIRNYREHFDASSGLPLWMAAEIMTFGNMLTFFRLLKSQDKKAIAEHFGITRQVMESWLVSLNYVRNVCAHHVRIWNRNISVSPLIPQKLQAWHEQEYPVEATRIYSILCIFRFLLDSIAPQSQWQKRLIELLNQFPFVSRSSMGIPDGFENAALWKRDK